MLGVRKPKPHRSPEQEDNSRGKSMFALRKLMSHDSPTELRNPRFDKQIYALSLSEGEP
jgi:hypothetical protein